MKYMVSWKIPTDSCKQAVEKFLSTGAPMLEGLNSLGRWHAPRFWLWLVAGRNGRRSCAGTTYGGVGNHVRIEDYTGHWR